MKVRDPVDLASFWCSYFIWILAFYVFAFQLPNYPFYYLLKGQSSTLLLSYLYSTCSVNLFSLILFTCLQGEKSEIVEVRFLVFVFLSSEINTSQELTLLLSCFTNSLTNWIALLCSTLAVISVSIHIYIYILMYSICWITTIKYNTHLIFFQRLHHHGCITGFFRPLIVT